MVMRLFVAILLPEAILPAVEEACAPLRTAEGARLLPRQNWHITLRFIGEVPNDKVEKVKTALAGVKFLPFGVSLFGAGAFPSAKTPRAIWIGGESEGAEELAAKIDSALSFLSLPKEKFKLHLTVARSKGRAELSGFLKTGQVGSFEVRSFALVKSTLAPSGAAYEVLKEFQAEEMEGKADG
ncbi:MAG: RNA 2',3'-cyclic phosphodiesterase [Candidatus Micrarchaeota archaeon]|nr:RNA 2',3'-cyclic phosphodiesterase [Candidatus Micrarchaeota archaeon]